MRPLLVALGGGTGDLSHNAALNQLPFCANDCRFIQRRRLIQTYRGRFGMRSLDELFDLRDMAFVEAAYLLMVQRPADPIGKAYYLGRLRGGYSQISVLDQLWRSPEADPVWSEAPKLRELLERYRNAIRPPIGLWRRRFDPVFGISRSLRRARALENELARSRQEILAKCAELSSEVTLLRDFIGRTADGRQSSSGRMTMKLSSNAPGSTQNGNVPDARDIELSSVGRDVLRSLRD